MGTAVPAYGAPAVPKLLASSVIRGAQRDESHGGLCICDFQKGTVEYAIDWNSTDIDVSGRGGDRGLRGVAIYNEQVYALSNNALLQFGRNLRLQEKYSCAYLKHCHELSVYDHRAFIVSTGFDAVLVFDLRQGRFVAGFHLHLDNERLRLSAFHPEAGSGPKPADVFHLNSVTCSADGLFFAGTRTGGLLRLRDTQFSGAAKLPQGTHNAQPFRGGIIYNDTLNNCITAELPDRKVTIAIDPDPEEAAHWHHAGDTALARPLFGRGLCVLSPELIAAGSSPSTITVYDVVRGVMVTRLAISRDVRNAIHGISIWPFAGI
jgi:hypothetical protein